MSIRFVLPLPAIALTLGVVRVAAQSDPAGWAAESRGGTPKYPVPRREGLESASAGKERGMFE